MIITEIDYEKEICCPFCSQTVIPKDSEEDATLTPCPHTMIIAHDEGIEYATENVNIERIENMVDDEDFTWEEGLEKLDHIGSHLLTRYMPAPSFFGVYALFSNNID